MMKQAAKVALATAVLLPTSLRAQQDQALVAEGAQVYNANCGRCHNARSSTERTDADWAVIVGHMRARGNLTRSQARAVLAYLRLTNLSEGTSASGSGGSSVEADPIAAAAMPALERPARREAPPRRVKDRGGVGRRR